MFTQEDSLCEILLKVMMAEAWQAGPLDDERRSLVEGWLQTLCMEGPECARIQALMDRGIDAFQAELHESELRAALASEENRRRVRRLLDRILGQRRTVFPLEAAVTEKIERLMNDRSGIERLLQS